MKLKRINTVFKDHLWEKYDVEDVRKVVTKKKLCTFLFIYHYLVCKDRFTELFYLFILK